MLADPERKAYEAFALKRLSWFQVFSPAALKLYWKLLRSGMKQERYEGDDIYQSGGDFLIDRKGNILFAHRSQDPADRPAVARLLMAIDHISGERSNGLRAYGTRYFVLKLACFNCTFSSGGAVQTRSARWA